MYLGFLLILTGWAVWLGNLMAFAFLPAFVLFTNRFQITPEERALTTIFGEDFKTYCAQGEGGFDASMGATNAKGRGERELRIETNLTAKPKWNI